jgi:hypothetical protein
VPDFTLRQKFINSLVLLFVGEAAKAFPVVVELRVPGVGLLFV